MRYFPVDGTYTPKHCIYGPRQREGVLLDDWEWNGINDTLHRWKRDRDAAESYAEKERNKRDLSYNITKNWQNTLASIKTQSEQRRREKHEKDRQDKINKYNEILESRREEKKPILARARRMLFDGKDSTRTLVTAMETCAVITEREKQIEFAKRLKEEKAKMEEEWVEKMKKDVEDYRREVREVEMKKAEERRSYAECLAKQLSRAEERRKWLEDTEGKKRKEEEEDNAKMSALLKDMKECQEKEKRDEIKRTRLLYEKSYFATELSKSLAAEDDEENEVNRMINKYAKRYEKERVRKEASIIADAIANREKMTEMLVRSADAKTDKTEEIYERGVREREEEMSKRAREKEEEKRKAASEMAAWNAEHNARVAGEKAAEKNALKWTILQNERKRDMDKAWVAETKKREREVKMRTREGYDAQMREKAVIEEERRKRDDVKTADKDDEELLKYCGDAVEYVKSRGWKDYPILDAAARLKKEMGVASAAAGNEEVKDEERQQMKQKCGRPTGLLCYCFKN